MVYIVLLHKNMFTQNAAVPTSNYAILLSTWFAYRCCGDHHILLLLHRATLIMKLSPLKSSKYIDTRDSLGINADKISSMMPNIAVTTDITNSSSP